MCIFAHYMSGRGPLTDVIKFCLPDIYLMWPERVTKKIIQTKIQGIHCIYERQIHSLLWSSVKNTINSIKFGCAYLPRRGPLTDVIKLYLGKLCVYMSFSLVCMIWVDHERTPLSLYTTQAKEVSTLQRMRWNTSSFDGVELSELQGIEVKQRERKKIPDTGGGDSS